jgi:Kef-type K+ transport system membrane component KefB
MGPAELDRAGDVDPAGRFDLIRFVATYVPTVMILLWNWQVFVAMVFGAIIAGVVAAWSQRGNEAQAELTSITT